MLQGFRKTLRPPSIRNINRIYRHAFHGPTGAVGSSMLPVGRTSFRLLPASTLENPCFTVLLQARRPPATTDPYGLTY